jgi:hypothetical protein
MAYFSKSASLTTSVFDKVYTAWGRTVGPSGSPEGYFDGLHVFFATEASGGAVPGDDNKVYSRDTSIWRGLVAEVTDGGQLGLEILDLLGGGLASTASRAGEGRLAPNTGDGA